MRRRPQSLTALVLAAVIGVLAFVTQTFLVLLMSAVCLLLGWLVLIFGPDFEFSVWRNWTAAAAAVLAFACAISAVCFTTRSQDGDQPPSRPSRSAIAIGRLIWLACVFIAGTGIAYYGMMFPAEFPRSFRGPSRSFPQSKNNLKQIGLSMHNYADVYGDRFPPAETHAGDRQLHAWPTRLLPFIDQSQTAALVDWNVPWNDPANDEAMKTVVEPFTNWKLRDFQKDERGYAVMHYAANNHVLNRNEGRTFASITDGMSNTLLGGEVATQFTLWGQPPNARDPLLGINKSPAGFGSPFQIHEPGRDRSGCHFLMSDGAVKWVSDDIDPEVLKAISRPNDQLAVPDF